jgi:hypothetical protein
VRRVPYELDELLGLLRPLDGLEAVYGRRPTLILAYVVVLLTASILPESLVGQQEGNSALLYC